MLMTFVNTIIVITYQSRWLQSLRRWWVQGCLERWRANEGILKYNLLGAACPRMFNGAKSAKKLKFALVFSCQ